MNLETYLTQRRSRQEQAPLYRRLCTTCLQPEFSCYCAEVRPFDPQVKFVILNHPIEMRRRIATGRMSHLCLKNSELIVGHNYSENDRINELIADPNYHCVILYPGSSSTNLTKQTHEEKKQHFLPGKNLAVFVIDGTWATARQTARQSENLRNLPRISFTPPRPSNFRVRKQPAAECFSTIEAIHHTIELLGDQAGFPVAERIHDRLLDIFDLMVERQLKIIEARGKENLSPRALIQYRFES